MEKLGRLLAASALGHEDQTTIQAAAIIAASSKTIQQELKLTADEAQAVSYRRREVVVKVSHGAIGGQISIHEQRLLDTINSAASKLYANRGPLVDRIVIRQN